MNNDEKIMLAEILFSKIPQIVPQLQVDTTRELLSGSDRYVTVLSTLNQKGDQDAVKRLMAFTKRT